MRSVRRVKRVTLFAAAGILMGSCAASEPTVVVWQKAGASQQELERAREECDAEPPDLRSKSVRRDRYEADAKGKAFVVCMNEKGWTWRTNKAREGE